MNAEGFRTFISVAYLEIFRIPDRLPRGILGSGWKPDEGHVPQGFDCTICPPSAILESAWVGSLTRLEPGGDRTLSGQAFDASRTPPTPVDGECGRCCTPARTRTEPQGLGIVLSAIRQFPLDGRAARQHTAAGN